MNYPYAIRLSWRNAALSLAVTAGLWLTPWLVWPSSRVVTAPGGRRAPVIRYVRSSEGIDGAAWSAVLIPLPTPEGFSKQAAAQGGGPSMESLLKPHVIEAPFLEVAPERGGGVDMGLLTMREDRLFRPEGTETPVFSALASNRVEGLQVEWDDTLAAREIQAPALKGLPSGEGNGVWAGVTAYVGVDAKGWVQHVLLDNTSGQTNIDAAIVRGLLQGRGGPGPGPSEGRVRVYYSRNGKMNGDVRN